MPRYQFRLHDGAGCRDPHALTLATPADARRMALLYLAEMLRSAAHRPDEVLARWRLDVSCEDGAAIFSLQILESAAANDAASAGEGQP